MILEVHPIKRTRLELVEVNEYDEIIDPRFVGPLNVFSAAILSWALAFRLPDFIWRFFYIVMGAEIGAILLTLWQ